MTNGTNDPYVRWVGKAVVAIDVLGTKWTGVLRELTYSYVTLDADLVLRRDHIVALRLRERDG